MKLIKVVSCAFLIILLLTGCKNKIFYLDDKYYNNRSFMELDNSTLNTLIENKESFAVFVYQPLCEASSEFESVLNSFLNQHQISFYKVAFSDIKNTDLGKTIKYYPSFIIYKDGKIVDYLEADKDEDIEYYKSVDGFKKWFSSYVFVNESYNVIEEEELEINKDLKIDVEIKNISYDENKVNIYLFWGDGCPHCENAIKFFNSIESEYGKYFTLNKFEIWHNEENKKIANQFASKMGEKAKGVPYIIIGEKSFFGFSKSYEDDIIEAITSQYENSYDVYFN